MSTHPLPHVPNFRVASGEPGSVHLNWADYPMSTKEGHKLLGYRIYRSNAKDQLGQIIADENNLSPSTFAFEDTDPQAGPNRYYTIVAIEDFGAGDSPFGASPYGNPDTTGFGFPPFNQRPFGTHLQGYGQSLFGTEAYGL